jgi:hypothetical protein
MKKEDDKRGLFTGIMNTDYQPQHYNTRDEPIQMTGLPLDKIPPDTPNYLTDLTYYKIMDNLYSGQSLRSTLVEMGCTKTIVGSVMRWIMKDEGRKKEYLEAKEVGAEIMAEEMVDIADGKMDESALPEDVNRSTLRVKTRGAIIAFNNKARFSKETTVNINVDLKQALEDANKRATIFEGELVNE